MDCLFQHSLFFETEYQHKKNSFMYLFANSFKAGTLGIHDEIVTYLPITTL